MLKTQFARYNKPRVGAGGNCSFCASLRAGVAGRDSKRLALAGFHSTPPHGTPFSPEGGNCSFCASLRAGVAGRDSKRLALAGFHSTPPHGTPFSPEGGIEIGRAHV